MFRILTRVNGKKYCFSKLSNSNSVVKQGRELTSSLRCKLDRILVAKELPLSLGSEAAHGSTGQAALEKMILALTAQI
jgi:hypothetical protein